VYDTCHIVMARVVLMYIVTRVILLWHLWC